MLNPVSYFMKFLILLLSLGLLSACQLMAPKTDEPLKTQADLSPEIVQKYTQAIKLMESGNEDAALKVFDGVSKLNDSLSGPYVNRGLIYLKQGEKEKSEQAFRDALQRNDKNVTALNQLGILLREKKDFAAARKNYEAALAVDDNHLNAHLNLGVLCDIYLQDKTCAMQHYKAYQNLIADDEQVNNWIIDLEGQL